jgi:hypothetical protein
MSLHNLRSTIVSCNTKLRAISVVLEDLSLLGYDSVIGRVAIADAEHSVFILMGECTRGFLNCSM